MLRNYLKIALRNLSRNKIYGVINVTGLAVGMAVSLLIGLWIWDELSWNHYHERYPRLAQVRDIQDWNGHSISVGAVDVPVKQELLTRFPGDFKRLALFSATEDNHILTVGDKKIERTVLYSEPEFPDMLSLHMQEGRIDALKDPASTIIASSLAHDLFGHNDPMGRIIRIDTVDMRVAGLFEDLPSNSTMADVGMMLPWAKYLDTHVWVKNTQTEWGRHYVRLMAEVRDGADFDKINAKIRDLPKDHVKLGHEGLLLNPLDRSHLYNEFKDGHMAGGRIQFVWLFGIIGGFVLLLACINFMNLSTARSERRAKEVGIRKAIGSLRGQLIAQFLGESLLVAFMALVLALILVQASLPFFNNLASKHMSVPWGQPAFWSLILGFTLFTGLISGSYPAFYLSSYDPVKVLKGTFRAGRFASLPRRILVVVQFTVSIALIIGTIIVFRQIQYARSRPVGYSREGLLSIDISLSKGFRRHYTDYDAIRSEMLGTGVIVDMTESAGPQTDIWSSQSGFEWSGKDPASLLTFGAIAVTHDYGKTVGWEMLRGRDFSRSYATDSAAFIVNESAAKIMGFADPIGKVIKFQGHDHPIIGVTKDMVMESPYTAAQPTVFFIDYTWNNYITLRVKPDVSMHDALAKIGAVYRQHDPDGLFNYELADDAYAAKFAAEERIGNLASFFASLAILISCLGLFGLASFVAEQRTREIGVRKVLGASVFSLWKQLCTEFVLLVLLSCLIAIPIAQYFLSQWLQRYEYHTRITWWIFAGAGIGALVITLLTVSHQIIRAALMNPVRSLRTE
ncbi:MAG: ABC transporter permease [Bacteroidota bacterium]|nr:ABC transporter permease [Bacteroidota bacterium]